MKRKRKRRPVVKGRRSAVWGGWALAILALTIVAVVVHRTTAPRPRVHAVVASAPVAPPRPPPSPSPPSEPAILAVPLAPPPALVPAPPPAAEPPWLRFAGATVEADGRPVVAIVIDDLGPDRARTERAAALPAAVTLSFVAYAGEVRSEAESARRGGHELLVHVPMEPVDRSNDMGPNGLATALPHDELLRRLRWDLDRLDAYVGINNHMGSRFTADAQAMAPVIEELKSRGLMFLDSRTSAATVGARLAQRAGVPFAERDVFLDDEINSPAIEHRLADVEAASRRTGSAVAIGHPHDATLAALARWIAELPEKGIVLVPLTAIVRLRAGAMMHAGLRAGMIR
jgi:polysaccharide deacetylase 2 family uncharacterized protein YibQ